MDDIIGKKIVKTRKDHICFGCGRNFTKGSTMEKSFVIDFKPWTCYLCESCIKVCQELEWDDEFGFSDLRDRALELEGESICT